MTWPTYRAVLIASFVPTPYTDNVQANFHAFSRSALPPPPRPRAARTRERKRLYSRHTGPPWPRRQRKPSPVHIDKPGDSLSEVGAQGCAWRHWTSSSAPPPPSVLLYPCSAHHLLISRVAFTSTIRQRHTHTHTHTSDSGSTLPPVFRWRASFVSANSTDSRETLGHLDLSLVPVGTDDKHRQFKHRGLN